MGNMMGNKDDTEQFDYTVELMKQKVGYFCRFAQI